jgi:hypothetical protein
MPTTTVTKYYSVNGQIIGEKVGSNSRVDYLTDALGSVTATVDQNAAVVNTYRYKPYGAQLSKTGSGPDPAFRWVGSLGYRQTGVNQSDVYVRARHYGTAAGQWTTAAIGRGGNAIGLRVYLPSSPVSSVENHGSDLLAETPPANTKDITCRIGSVPDWANCSLSCRNAWACTSCNFRTGETFTICCEPLADCGDECLFYHEQKHREQETECCARYAKCYARELHGLGDTRKCIKAYDQWEELSNPWAECMAYLGQIDCFNDQMARMHCDCTAPPPQDMVCCNHMRSWYNIVVDRAWQYCGKLGPGVGSSNPCPCPFDENGNIVPNWPPEICKSYVR